MAVGKIVNYCSASFDSIFNTHVDDDEDDDNNSTGIVTEGQRNMWK
jgi:hypothetical protein